MVSLPRKRESRISRHSTKLDCGLRRNGQWYHSAEVLQGFLFSSLGFPSAPLEGV